MSLKEVKQYLQHSFNFQFFLYSNSSSPSWATLEYVENNFAIFMNSCLLDISIFHRNFMHENTNTFYI